VFGGGAEGGEHDWAGDAGVGGDRQGIAAVVVEPGQDLDVGAGGEAVVGEVGLPGFVGLLGLEPDVGRLGSFVRLRCDEPGAGQGASDRGDRHPSVMVVFEVPTDRVRAGVESFGDEFSTDLDDQLDRRRRDRGRGTAGSPRARLKRCVTFGAVTSDKLADPALGHAVGAGDLGLRAALDNNSGDHQTRFGHPRA